MILVIGGRSKIGATLIGELLGRGQQVRALVRAGEPAGSLAATAEAVTGDLADEGSLVTAMAGIEKVFLLSSPHPDAVSWHRNAIDAARRTQVQLLVRSSILGADGESPPEFISAHTACGQPGPPRTRRLSITRRAARIRAVSRRVSCTTRQRSAAAAVPFG